MTPLLETRQLKMRFGGVTAVNDVDFVLQEGELRCLIGPNGAGKSTFFKCLTGQHPPTAGEILFRGRSITGLNSHDIARLGVGIKTQVPNVFNGLSPQENVWVAARRGRTPRMAARVADEVMVRVGISDAAGRTVGELAHGQRQLVELAIVLAAAPALILLDEPAAGMTLEETERLAAIVREINRTQALIVVEHDMQFVRMIARRITVFHQGAVLVEDDVEAVMRDSRVRDVYLGRRVAA